MPKVIVANRGEIAIRVLRSARELGWQTVSIYTEDDSSHATFADEVFLMDGVEGYMDVDYILDVAGRTNATYVHPGYGYLSESAKLAQMLSSTLSTSNPIVFVGPSVATLEIAGDKMKSRQLAASLDVPIAPGRMLESEDDARRFVDEMGLPVMIKALDGGGGRGIRMVSKLDQLQESFKRCKGESPSGQIFVEKALFGDGWRHIEVQVVGDGAGGVVHLWERDCTVQRRFQKIVEVAPSGLEVSLLQPLFEASLRIARNLMYKGLGTFEFLVNASTGDWVFLEINPRLQVEHTITEELINMDLVQLQLSLFLPGANLRDLGLLETPNKQGFAIQLRLTAEDPRTSFKLATGKIAPHEITMSAGRGVRVDTWLTRSPGATPNIPFTVSPLFDSLLAKIIVTGRTRELATATGLRALGETGVVGQVKTNIDILRGVLSSPDWRERRIDTLWLERNLDVILAAGETKRPVISVKDMASPQGRDRTLPAHDNGRSLLLEPGSTFSLELGTLNSDTPAIKHVLSITSISHNAFPSQLSGTIQSTLTPTPLQFSLSQSARTLAGSADVEFANPTNPLHVALPLTGKIVELHPALVENHGGGGIIREGEVVAVVSVMKMENAVLATSSGLVKRIGKGVKVGRVVHEGALLYELEGDGVKGKL